MAELVEEIAELLEKFKRENSENNEDLSNLLVDIKSNLENINSDNADFVAAVKDLSSNLSSKISDDEDKIMSLGERLKHIEVLFGESSLDADYSQLHDKIELLSSNFKEAVESIINFANKDSESKNVLFDKVTALEAAVNNNETSEVVKQKTTELIGSFEHFVTDANLRHGNLISAMADLRHVMEEEAAKNTYLVNSLNGSLTENSEKLATLDGTVSAQLGTVNSKLFSLGDDIQKTLNDGFEHLKYLSTNLSEHMNSNSIDMKTTLECLRANLADYSEQLKLSLEDFNTDFGQKVADSSNIQTTNAQSILANISDLASRLDEKSKEYENYLGEGLSKVYEFLTVYRDAVLTVNNENKEVLTDRLNAFEENLRNSYNEYKTIAESVRPKLEEAQALITETADSVILGVVNSNNEIISELRQDLISSAGNNLEVIIGKINETSDNIVEFKNSVAENLSGYLSSIKDLFIDYSNKIDLTMKDDEVLSRFSKLEEMISGAEVSRNDNYNSLKSALEEYKLSVEKFSDDIKLQNENNLDGLAEVKACTREILPKLSSLSNLETILSEKNSEYKDALSFEIAGVKGSISDIINAVKELPVADNTEVLAKLTEFEVQLNDSSNTYENNLEALKDALGEYIINNEKNRTEVVLKLDGAFGEVKKIQANFDEISAKMSTLVGDSGLIEILANIRQQFNVVLSRLNEEKNELLSVLNERLTDSVSDTLETVNDSLNDGISSISSNLYLIGQNIEEVRCKQSENAEYLRGNFEEKMLGLQADIERTVSDIKNVVDLKTIVVSDSLNQLREAIDKFVGFDYQQILADMKTQIEFSYVKIAEDVKSILENGASFEKIENLYKDAVLKLSAFEEYVKEVSENNFDLINHTLLNISSMAQNNFAIAEKVQSILEDDLVKLENHILENRVSIKSQLVDNIDAIKAVIEEKKNLEIEDFRSAILPLLDNEETLNLIKTLNRNIAERIDEFKQDHTLAAQDILDVINSASNTVDYTLDVINEKFEDISAVNSDLTKKINEIDAKLDLIAVRDEVDIVLDSLEDVNESVLDVRQTVSNINNLITEVNENTSSCNSIIPAIKMCVDKLKETISFAVQELKAGPDYETALKEIGLKLDILSTDGSKDVTAQLLEIRNLIQSINGNVEKTFGFSDLLQTIDNKLDILAANNNSEVIDELQAIRTEISNIFAAIEENKKFEETVDLINKKIDVLAANDDSELYENLEAIKLQINSLQNDVQTIDNNHSEFESLVKNIDNKIDILAQDDNSDVVESLEQVNEQIGIIQTDIKSVEGNHSKLEELINTLHAKVDILADSDDSEVQEEILEIRSLIEEQIENGNSNDVKESLHKLLEQISAIDLSKQAGEIKEAVISAVVAVTNEISFVEETEEIKDFVNERTNELHRTMMDVKHQLSTLTCTPDDMDFYSYTLQDVESDIAKLRLILKDMSGDSSANEICVMSNNILKISKTLENLKDAFVEAEAKRLQGNELSEQVVSISSRLNQLLLNKKEVDDIILNHLAETRDSLYRIDNTDITKEIEKILISMDEKLAYSTNLNTILKNVMMYLGEWMDGTTETISSIYDKASKINSVSAAMEELRKSVPDKRELIDAMESRFNEQDAKISRLEEQLDRISGMLNSRDYAETLDKMDRIDDKLSRLSENIEKLASYVE